MSRFENLKMVAGTAKTSHILLLFTSVVLISIGVYGTVISNEYGCDNGVLVNLNDMKNIQKDMGHNKSFSNCMHKAFSPPHDNINKFDRCLNDYGKGHFRCMEGGLMGLSITSIVIGALMLLLSSYLLFM